MELEEQGLVIVDKELLTPEQIEYFIREYDKSQKDHSPLDNRIHASTVIPKEFIEDWIVKLGNYIFIEDIYPFATFKEYMFGGLKDHKDSCYEYKGKLSRYTLLIYLNSCDTGETAIKRSKFRLPKNNEYKHERIFIKPKIGHAVVFNSDLIHRAEETYDKKLILHTRIF